MRGVIALLLALLLLLQYSLWFGKGGLIELRGLHAELVSSEAENERLRERNRALEAEVDDLREGIEAVEERARSEMGMVKPGELFFHIIPSNEEADDE